MTTAYQKVIHALPYSKEKVEQPYKSLKHKIKLKLKIENTLSSSKRNTLTSNALAIKTVG